jgi:LysM repeat protein
MKRTGRLGWGVFALIVWCLPVVAGGASPPDPVAGAPVPGSEESYVVKKGDTLWGISKDLLQDPLLWPRLWEQNRHIADPNLIYPGDRLTLPGKELAPAPVAEPPKPEPATAAAEAPPAILQEAPKPAPAPAPAPVPAAPSAPEPPPPALSRSAVLCSPVLTTEAKVESVAIGSLLQSTDNRLLISMEDDIVVGLTANVSLNPGDRLFVIRAGQQLLQPRSGQPISRVLYVLGLVEVKEVRDRVVLGKVSYSCGAMQLGDLVVPYTPAQFPEDKIARPAQRSVEGVILDDLRGEQLIGQLQVVFLNVGRAQGVGSGDVVAIYRLSPLAVNAAGTVFAIPAERLGEAVIIRVTDQTATAAVTDSKHEIRIGDRVVLSRQIAP